MTESILEIIPTGGSAKWDQMGLGYDSTTPIVFGVGDGQSSFSLADTTTAGVISKITICYRIACSEAYGCQSAITGRMYTHDAWYSTAAIDRAEADPTWYYVDVALNPSTSAAWTWPEIDALTAGIKVSVLYGGWTNMLQFKVQIHYTPAAYVPTMLVKGSVGCGCGSMMF